MEIEATCHTVDVEHFTSEIQVGTVFAFERVQVDAYKGDAAAGDELIFERSAPHDFVTVIHEGVDKSVELFLAQFTASFLRRFFQTTQDEVLPQALRQCGGMAVQQLFVGILSEHLTNKRLHIVLVLTEPVDANGSLIVVFI